MQQIPVWILDVKKNRGGENNVIQRKCIDLVHGIFINVNFLF